MGDILKDSRFTKYLNDPRYKQIPKHERKVKIDKRFQSMFNDDKFKVKYSVDKRGRPINETSTENLRKYYDLDESEDSSDSSEDEAQKKQDSNEIGDSSQEDHIEPGRFVKRANTEAKTEEPVKFQNDKLVGGELDSKTKKRLLDLDIDYARGEGVLVTDSSSDEESSKAEEDSELEHEWGELDADAETTEDSTKRIAICNMDWDNIKATDLMVLLSSFLPPGGIIYHVKIYPSEYGLKRMQEEEIRGPIELTEDKQHDSGVSDDGGNEEGSSYHMEKLRRYQLNRLRYYYAVVTCDSVPTADKLYAECDGLEYESSATKLDLRFIPDDVEFDQEPREVCEKLPDLTKYKPRLFTTTALQQAKVDLTWDTTNPNRTEAIRGANTGKIDDLDLKEYLASSSEEDEPADAVESESEEESKDPILKYKMLLEDIEKKEEKRNNKDMEMEISWGVGIKDKAEELVKKKLQEDNKNLTPFEKIVQKKKEKKKQKKLKKKQNAAEQKDSDEENSSDDVPSDIDMNDPYFAEEFNKPEFKNKKSDKKKKHANDTSESDEEAEKKKAELELLLDEDDGKEHFSLKKIQDAESISKKSKRKKKLREKMKEQKQNVADFEMNLNDDRFTALYESHHFNIDPSDPNFKKTKNMEKLIQEKLKRRPVDVPDTVTALKKSKQDIELDILVKNIKRKSKNNK